MQCQQEIRWKPAGDVGQIKCILFISWRSSIKRQSNLKILSCSKQWTPVWKQIRNKEFQKDELFSNFPKIMRQQNSWSFISVLMLEKLWSHKILLFRKMVLTRDTQTLVSTWVITPNFWKISLGKPIFATVRTASYWVLTNCLWVISPNFQMQKWNTFSSLIFDHRYLKFPSWECTISSQIGHGWIYALMYD